ncbi:hypothetical protein Bbelb_314720 [Branchiostoma belcheri]|nr:hypothetical protein Bbelb_314720 [Branchiostoma belcheri]
MAGRAEMWISPEDDDVARQHFSSGEGSSSLMFSSSLIRSLHGKQSDTTDREKRDHVTVRMRKGNGSLKTVSLVFLSVCRSGPFADADDRCGWTGENDVDTDLHVDHHVLWAMIAVQVAPPQCADLKLPEAHEKNQLRPRFSPAAIVSRRRSQTLVMRWFLCLLLGLGLSTGARSEKKDLFLFGMIEQANSPATALTDPAYQGLLPACEMAIEQINNRSDILPGYNLKIPNVQFRKTILKPLRCKNELPDQDKTAVYPMNARGSICCAEMGQKDARPGTTNGGRAIAVYHFILTMFHEPTMIMVLGPGGTVVDLIAQTAPIYNLIQITYSTYSPTLSDRKTYPFLFKTIQTDNVHNPARVALLQHFGWDKVATIQDTDDRYTTIASDLNKLLGEANITVQASGGFGKDVTTQLSQLENLMGEGLPLLELGQEMASLAGVLAVSCCEDYESDASM